MKNFAVVFSLVMLMGSCAIFTPRDEFRLGMTENQFLSRNPKAVINTLEGNTKIYRLQRDDRFYVLATFVGGELTHVEEREVTPLWHQNTDPERQPREN